MKKKKGEKTARPNDLQNNPFKQLRGFSVSLVEEKSAPVKPLICPVISEEPASFSEEMARLGVQRIAKGAQGSEPKQPEPKSSVEPPQAATDADLFVAALGQLDTRFADQYPDEEPAPASPRRMKLVHQGKLIPEASLDLHGLTRDAARGKVQHFLENAVYHGMKTVLIVTGWGRGSEGEPVLRREVETFLATLGRTWVIEWGRAPKQHGGEGALVVFLKTANRV